MQGGNQSSALERSMVVKAALSDACHAARTGSASFGHQDGRQPCGGHCCCGQHHPTVALAVCTSIAAGGWEGLTEMPQWQKFWLNFGQRLPELGSEQKLQQARRPFLEIFLEDLGWTWNQSNLPLLHLLAPSLSGWQWHVS